MTQDVFQIIGQRRGETNLFVRTGQAQGELKSVKELAMQRQAALTSPVGRIPGQGDAGWTPCEPESGGYGRSWGYTSTSE